MNNIEIIRTMPAVALRGLVIFPYTVLHFDVGRDMSVAALEKAMTGDQMVFLCTQKDMNVDEPKAEDLYTIGTVSKIKQILKMPGNNIRVLVEGLRRARLIGFLPESKYLSAQVSEIDEPDQRPTPDQEAYMRTLMSLYSAYARMSNRIAPESLASVGEIASASRLADTVASNSLFKLTDKQAILEIVDASERLRTLCEMLTKELEIIEIESDISKNLKKQIDKSQREYYLREQIKVIQKELGDEDNVTAEADMLKEKIESLPLSEEAKEKALKEVSRMAKMSSSSPEIAVIRTYLDWIISLPWGVETKDNLDFARIKKVLDEDHYGLKAVKERILEYIAVCKMKNDMRGPILCFIGPPGVGKTSIARSIARAINRNFVRASLGGVRDEAEIRGHRRTYIGAIPGRIISSIKQAGSMNPVFLLDEIDKMSSDFKGDPASAMLEVLDPEINNTFVDHYLDMAFDLSKVMFLTTANSIENIPRPLLDRMEIIELSSYMQTEKLMIAKKHLLKRQLKEHGLKPTQLKITDAAMNMIIESYTLEPGVRNLERMLATVCRRVAALLLQENMESYTLTPKNIADILGPIKYARDDVNKKNRVGVVNGLAWTVSGGQTLSVEASVMDGNGKVELTGHLGDVMKESARAAISYIRSHAKELNIMDAFYEDKDLHIHCPQGAIPKDGPSAGITMATALVSALTQKPVRADTAMTGEITLTGNVLPIGGLKEKLLAAQRAGIKTVIIPKDNERDLSEISDEIKGKLKIIPVSSVGQVFEKALIG